MTEQEWLASDDPRAMLGPLVKDRDIRRSRGCGPPWISDRKLRLFVEAITGITAWVNMGDDFDWESFAREVVAAEHARHHPPLATQAALLRDIVGDPFQPVMLPKCRRCDGDGEAHGSDRPFEWTPEVGYPGPCPVCHGLKSDSPWLTWQDGTVPKMAQTIYDERRWQDMPILADAMEQAGCTDEAILAHCRGYEQGGTCTVERIDSAGRGKLIRIGSISISGSPPVTNPSYLPQCVECKGTGWHPLRGPHVRGCWVVDLLLGKE